MNKHFDEIARLEVELNNARNELSDANYEQKEHVNNIIVELTNQVNSLNRLVAEIGCQEEL